MNEGELVRILGTPDEDGWVKIFVISSEPQVCMYVCICIYIYIRHQMGQSVCGFMYVCMYVCVYVLGTPDEDGWVKSFVVSSEPQVCMYVCVCVCVF